MAYVTYTLNASPQGTFQGLGDEESIQMDQPGQQWSAGQLVMTQGWLYLVGSYPLATAPSVRIEAQGTKLVIQVIPDEEMPQFKTVRVILLEGYAVNVSKLDGSDTHQITDEQTYLDVQVRSDGVITHWTGPSEFDADNTPGSEGLMTAVDEARDEKEVP